MDPLVAFTIPGRPRGKQRARSADGQRPYTPPETRAAEKEIAALFLQACDSRTPLTGPVALTIVAVFAIPIGWPAGLRHQAARGLVPCTSKPDRDNIEKLICDALNGLAWCDDAQIADGPVTKRYGAPARTEVVIESLACPELPATPGDQRRERWVDDGQPPKPRRAKPANMTKSQKKKLPTRLQQAVDRALGREKAAKPPRGPGGR